MSLTNIPKRHRYPMEVISFALWSYHRFNDSYRDVSERLAYRGIQVNYETIRIWCQKFGRHFIGTMNDVINLTKLLIFGTVLRSLFAPNKNWVEELLPKKS